MNSILILIHIRSAKTVGVLHDIYHPFHLWSLNMKPPNTQSYSPPLLYHPDDKWYIFELPNIVVREWHRVQGLRPNPPNPPSPTPANPHNSMSVVVVSKILNCTFHKIIEYDKTSSRIRKVNKKKCHHYRRRRRTTPADGSLRRDGLGAIRSPRRT